MEKSVKDVVVIKKFEVRTVETENCGMYGRLVGIGENGKEYELSVDVNSLGDVEEELLITERVV